jgi:hypothetical protein
MKNKLILALILCPLFSFTSFKLSSPFLKAADNAGMFNDPVYRILMVRKTIKEFITGKLIWKGLECNLPIVDDQSNSLHASLNVIVKRPELIFGATFVIVSPDHEHLFDLVAPSQQAAVSLFIQDVKSKSLINRYVDVDYHAVPTGTYALHPITGNRLPLFISDYSLEGFDTRTTNSHMAIPAHDIKDFTFAHQHNLEIKQVLTSPDEGKASSPQIDKHSGQLTSAYTSEFEDSIVINSGFINGPIVGAADKIIASFSQSKLGTAYSKNVLYDLQSKLYSVSDLQTIEAALQQEHKNLSQQQKDALSIAMIQVQSDFLGLVEHFLASAKETKELMAELIEESCTLRKNNDCYLLQWTRLKTSQPERVVFKRDIKTFNTFVKFCTDLFDFLGDFAASCPKALENLKNLRK